MNARLEELLAKLGQHFGKTTRWQALCKEGNATADEEKIKLAEQVLAEWSTGTVAEYYSHRAKLSGAKSISVDEFLGKKRTPTAITGEKAAGHSGVKPQLQRKAVSRIRYKANLAVSNFDDLIGEHFDLASPFRSTVPLLAYWSNSEVRLTELAKAIGCQHIDDALLHFEFRVSPTKGRGNASHTDLMILSRSVAIAVEAKYTEPKYKPVSAWLGVPARKNRRSVLEGWLELINQAAGCNLTVEKVQTVTYQLIHRTASACKPQADCHVVIYHCFDPTDALREYYRDQLKSFSALINAPDKLRFFFYTTKLDKTAEFANLQQFWSHESPKPDVTDAVCKLLKTRNVARFIDSAVLKF